MKTRLLAILMICAMCLTLLPGLALAEEAPAVPEPAEAPAEPAPEPEAPPVQEPETASEEAAEEPADPAADAGIPDGLQDLIELLGGGGSVGESAENGLRVYDAQTGENPCYLQVPVNETVTLQAAAEADDAADLVFRWYERISLLGVLQIPRDLRHEGASLTTEAITKERNYICMVTDRFGNKVAVNYYLTPDTGLRAWAVGGGEETGWRELSVPKGDTPVMEVRAEGIEPLTYAWHAYEQVQQEDYSEWERLDDILSTGESLAASPVTGAARYVCTVTDSYGYEAYVTFDLAVDNGFEAYAAEDPFTAKPGSKTVLRVIAKAEEGPITYRWYEMTPSEEDDDAWTLPGDTDPIPGAQSDTLSVTVTGTARYLCRVSDPYTTRDVFLKVEPDTGLTARVRGSEESWAELHAPEGETAALAVDAHVDEGGLTYRWQRLVPVEDWYEYVTVDGADTDELVTVPILQAEDYTCTVTDDYGSFREVSFRIYPDDGFTLEPDGDYTVKTEALYEDDPVEYDVCYVCAEPGGTVTLAYRAESRSGGLQAEWGSELWDWERQEREANAPLVLENVMEDGLYLAAVYNKFREEKDLYFRVVVNWDPLDKNHDARVDMRDAAAFLADPGTDGYFSAVLVLRRVLGLDA